MGMDFDFTWFERDITENDNYDYDRLFDQFHSLSEEAAVRLQFNDHYVVTNRWAIFGALQRFSRDIYGFSRIAVTLEKNGIDDSKREAIMKTIKDEHKGAGLRVVSASPYCHKRVAFFLYYFSIMKPFAIVINKSHVELNATQVDNIIHFNSLVSLSCVQKILLASVVDINGSKSRMFIDNDFSKDRDFLHDLTYRTINRSSLEAAMRYMIRPIKESEYQKKIKEIRK